MHVVDMTKPYTVVLITGFTLKFLYLILIKIYEIYSSGLLEYVSERDKANAIAPLINPIIKIKIQIHIIKLLPANQTIVIWKTSIGYFFQDFVINLLVNIFNIKNKI